MQFQIFLRSDLEGWILTIEALQHCRVPPQLLKLGVVVEPVTTLAELDVLLPSCHAALLRLVGAGRDVAPEAARRR